MVATRPLSEESIQPWLVDIKVTFRPPMTPTEFGTRLAGAGGSFSQDEQGRTTRAWVEGRAMSPDAYDELCWRSIDKFARACDGTRRMVAAWRSEVAFFKVLARPRPQEAPRPAPVSRPTRTSARRAPRASRRARRTAAKARSPDPDPPASAPPIARREYAAFAHRANRRLVLPCDDVGTGTRVPLIADGRLRAGVTAPVLRPTRGVNDRALTQVGGWGRDRCGGAGKLCHSAVEEPQGVDHDREERREIRGQQSHATSERTGGSRRTDRGEPRVSQDGNCSEKAVDDAGCPSCSVSSGRPDGRRRHGSYPCARNSSFEVWPSLDLPSRIDEPSSESPEASLGPKHRQLRGRLGGEVG
jgi:hypothetical protein